MTGSITKSREVMCVINIINNKIHNNKMKSIRARHYSPTYKSHQHKNQSPSLNPKDITAYSTTNTASPHSTTKAVLTSTHYS